MTDRAVVRCAAAWRTTAEAEHELVERWSALSPSPRVAATHFLPDHRGVVVGVEHTDGTLEVLGTDDPSDVAWVADRHRHRTGGRLFVFPGSGFLVDVLAVEALLGLTAIDEVVGVGGATSDPATPLDTRGFVRPTYERGRLRLLVRPAAHGLVVPFEQADPTPCCAAHG